MGEDYATLSGCPGEDRRIVRRAESDIRHTYKIKVRPAAEQAANNRPPKVLIGEQFQAASSIAA